MAKSDHSDGDEEVQAEMPPLETSNDSIRSNNGKREREESSEKEVKVPKKKIRTSDNVEVDAEGELIKSEDSLQAKKEKEDKTLAQDERSASIEEKAPNESTDKDISLAEESVKSTDTLLNEEKEQKEEEKKQEEEKERKGETQIEKKEKKEKKEDEDEDEDEDENEDDGDEGDNKKEEKQKETRRNIKKSNSKDIEVVEGLELSVECASDKESSSESDEEVKKPRSKTTIVKAKPNDSELDVSSSVTERSVDEESTETADTNKGTKRGRKRRISKTNEKRSSLSELESKESEDEENNEKPQAKQKGRNSRAKRGAKSSTESRRGRGRRRSVSKKDKDEEKVADEDEETNNIGIDKSATESKEKSDENSSDKESSSSGSDSDDDKTEDGKRTKRGSRPDDNKKIQALKKYIRAAGIKVKSYHDIWVGCKSNEAKVKKLKSLLEEHGITGRPTLEKCKKVKERNERLKEVSELDKSNIISEGRVTRARRGMDANKNSIVTSDTSPRGREARNTYKRLRSVADSDSE